MKQFRDKVAVVTGAASGIGRAMAERFAAEGMRVVLADVDAHALSEAADALKAAGAAVLAVPTDVADGASVEALATRTLETFGAVHVVCNNAGVGSPGGPIWERTVADWQWVLGVNLWGVIHGIRVFVPILLRAGEGHVVNTASMAGLLSSPFLGIYNATKHAVVAMSETLHAELALAGSAVKVSVLCPGFVRTRIADSSRTRPASLANSGPGDNPPSSQVETFIRQALESGLPPAEVAERVLQAIRDEQLYILTHPDYKPLLQRHLEEVIEERNPAPADQASFFTAHR
jgi:NAD(P)-dependent dehydrogenase (short-subunit alcohol dehydrogenase family)